MKLGDVLRKEREKKQLSADQVAQQLGLPADEYRRVEAGESSAEEWGPRLAQIAITLATPTSRLLTASGRAADAVPGAAGSLIREHRERRGKAPAEVAQALGLDEPTYSQIESGESPIESWGPSLLRFAEMIEQPVFNLFYPCGLPFQQIEDYP